MTETLRFGYNAGVPDDARAAWGCRAIWGYDRPDIVWDRQDAVGDEAVKADLLAHLRDVVGDAPWDTVEEDARALGLDPAKDAEAVIYEDDKVVMRANSNGSYGYLYVCAYPREEPAR